jgi:hypothetical protein
MKEEYAVGERFETEDGVTLEVKAQKGCAGCYYCISTITCHSIGSCAANCRADGNSVIFVNVTKTVTNLDKLNELILLSESLVEIHDGENKIYYIDAVERMKKARDVLDPLIAQMEYKP